MGITSTLDIFNVHIIICYNYITGGIIQHHCSDKPLDHAVQVIGYDFTTGMYYICKVNISCTLEVNVSTEFIKKTTDFHNYCFVYV